MTFTLALLFCLSVAACGVKQYPMEITVVNRTTYPIADIRISLTSEEDWGENRLETTLAEGESTEIDLGEYCAATRFNQNRRHNTIREISFGEYKRFPGAELRETVIVKTPVH